MNLLAACLVMVMEELRAFWTFVTIMEKIMPFDYYTSTLLASQADQRFFFFFFFFSFSFPLFHFHKVKDGIQTRVLKELLAEKCPKLFRHLEEYQVDLSLITFNWFLTIFSDCVPPQVIN